MRSQWLYERRRVLVPRRIAPVVVAGVTGSVVLCIVMAAIVRAVSADMTVDPAEALAFVVGRGSVAPFVAGVGAAVLVGSEFRHRTVELSVMLSSSRLVVAVAYFLGQWALAAAMAVVGAATAVLCTWAVAGVLASPVTLVSLLAAHLLATVVWATWGVGLALLTRSRAIASALLLLWALVIEPSVGGIAGVFGGVFADVGRLLPFTLLGVVASATAPADGVLLARPGLSPLLAAGIVVGVTVAIGAASCVRFVRQRSV